MLVFLLAAATALSSPQAAASTPQPATKPPCRNPDTSGKYHIGCGVTPPVVLLQSEPEYPKEAAARKLTASGVVLSLTVTADGHPVDIHVKESMVPRVPPADRAAQQLLEDKLVESVRHYKFKPALFQGKGVPVEMNVETSFNPF
jgi:protein TonB